MKEDLMGTRTGRDPSLEPIEGKEEQEVEMEIKGRPGA